MGKGGTIKGICIANWIGLYHSIKFRKLIGIIGNCIQAKKERKRYRPLTWIICRRNSTQTLFKQIWICIMLLNLIWFFALSGFRRESEQIRAIWQTWRFLLKKWKQKQMRNKKYNKSYGVIIKNSNLRNVLSFFCFVYICFDEQAKPK